MEGRGKLGDEVGEGFVGGVGGADAGGDVAAEGPAVGHGAGDDDAEGGVVDGEVGVGVGDAGEVGGGEGRDVAFVEVAGLLVLKTTW